MRVRVQAGMIDEEAGGVPFERAIWLSCVKQGRYNKHPLETHKANCPIAGNS